MQLSNNHVLITGGARGIGFAMAEAFLMAGSRVAVCGRSQAHLDQARSALPQLLTIACDVERDDDRSHLLNWVTGTFPNLNILINNAGIQRDIDFKRGLDEFQKGSNEIRVNLEAPIMLSGLFIPILTKAYAPAIINVSSGLGFLPSARMPVYSASKAGLHAFSVALRFQLAATGIKVVEIIPPAVDTELNPEGRAKRGGFKPSVTAREFVNAVMSGLEKDDHEIGFGMTANIGQLSRAELDKRIFEMNRRM